MTKILREMPCEGVKLECSIYFRLKLTIALFTLEIFYTKLRMNAEKKSKRTLQFRYIFILFIQRIKKS